MELTAAKFYASLTDTLAEFLGEGALAAAVHLPYSAPAPRPAGEIVNFLKRFGTAPGWNPPGAGTASAACETAVNAFIAGLAAAVNRSPAQITAVLNTFTRRAENRKPVCGKIPECKVCQLRKFCDFANTPQIPAVPASLAERLARGLEIPDAECLAAVLGGEKFRSGDLAAAQGVIDRFSSLPQALFDGQYAEFTSIRHVQPKHAVQLTALVRIFSAALKAHTSRPRVPMSNSRDFVDRYHDMFSNLPSENFYTILLDQRNRIIREVEIIHGTLTSMMITPREALAPALRENAAAVAFIHNHPSGDPTPSRADDQATVRLCDAAKILGVRVLDHIIIARDGYYSYADEGKIS